MTLPRRLGGSWRLLTFGAAVVALGAAPASGSSSGTQSSASAGLIAFASNRGGNFDIYVMKPDGSSARKLTNSQAIDRFPAWSPDGKKIAFASNRGGNFDIYVMNANGDGQRRLVANGGSDSSPVWSPDGKRIAFANGHGRSATVCNRDLGGDIEIVGVDGSGLDTVHGLSTLDSAPSWSPFGNQIAFQSLTALGTSSSGTGFLTIEIDLTSVELEGFTRSVETAKYGDQEINVDPAWSPRTAAGRFGGKIAFAHASLGRTGYPATDIWVINVFRPGERKISIGERRLTHLAGACHPSWSPDGKRIAFTANRGGNDDIYVMTGDGRGQKRLTDNPAKDLDPAWGQ